MRQDAPLPGHLTRVHISGMAKGWRGGSRCYRHARAPGRSANPGADAHTQRRNLEWPSLKPRGHLIFASDCLPDRHRIEPD